MKALEKTQMGWSIEYVNQVDTGQKEIFIILFEHVKGCNCVTLHLFLMNLLTVLGDMSLTWDSHQ